jgi:hypothetical protein
LVQREVRVAAELLLYSGKSVLLAGAPGTGKTRLGFELSQSFTGLDPVDVVGRGDLAPRELLYSYEPLGEGFRVVVGKLALSVMASWARLVQGLTPRWLLLDELNRMNAETALGSLFTALDLAHRGRIAVVPRWLVERTLSDGSLLDEVAAAAGTDGESAKKALGEALEASRRRGLDGLPLPYSWRAIATINLLDRSHLFRLGFALLRRFPMVLFPGVGAQLRPRIGDEAVARHAGRDRAGGVYEQVLGLLQGGLCVQALEELKAGPSLTAYDAPLYAVGLGGELAKRALESYPRVAQIVALVASRMADVGIELGPAVLADVCRLLAVAVLHGGAGEDLLADVAVASLLLPQLGAVAPRVKAELLLGGSASRAARVQRLLELVGELLGDRSMSAMYAEALKLEIPVQPV